MRDSWKHVWAESLYNQNFKIMNKLTATTSQSQLTGSSLTCLSANRLAPFSLTRLSQANTRCKCEYSFLGTTDFVSARRSVGLGRVACVQTSPISFVALGKGLSPRFFPRGGGGCTQAIGRDTLGRSQVRQRDDRWVFGPACNSGCPCYKYLIHKGRRKRRRRDEWALTRKTKIQR